MFHDVAVVLSLAVIAIFVMSDVIGVSSASEMFLAAKPLVNVFGMYLIAAGAAANLAGYANIHAQRSNIAYMCIVCTSVIADLLEHAPIDWHDMMYNRAVWQTNATTILLASSLLHAATMPIVLRKN